MADIVKLFEERFTPEEAMKEASDAAWSDIICFGYNQDGGFQLYSSHMDNNQALMMTKILETKIMEPFIKGDVV